MITKLKRTNNTIWYVSDNNDKFLHPGVEITEVPKVGEFITHKMFAAVFIVTKVLNDKKVVGEPLTVKARIYFGMNQTTKFIDARVGIELCNYLKIEKA